MDAFITSNPGLESRFRLTLEFDDYSDDELVDDLLAASPPPPTSPRPTRSVTRPPRDPRGDAARSTASATAVSCATSSSRRWCARRGGSATSTHPDVTQLRELSPTTSTDGPARAADRQLRPRRATGERRPDMATTTGSPHDRPGHDPIRCAGTRSAVARAAAPRRSPARPAGCASSGRVAIVACLLFGVVAFVSAVQPAARHQRRAQPRRATRAGADDPHQPREGRRERHQRVPRRRARAAPPSAPAYTDGIAGARRHDRRGRRAPNRATPTTLAGGQPRPRARTRA